MSISQISSALRSIPAKTIKCVELVSKYNLAITIVVVIVATRCFANSIDPAGALCKRPFLLRFITITLLDNLPLALTILAQLGMRFADLKNPKTLAKCTLFSIAFCEVMEFARFGAGKLAENYPDTITNLPCIWPRDYYAK